MPSYDVSTQAQVLALKQEGFKIDEITQRMQIRATRVKSLCKEAQARGWNPDKKGQILDEYVARKEGSGRPKKLIEEKIQEIVRRVGTDRFGAEKSTHDIANEVNLSQKSVWRA